MKLFIKGLDTEELRSWLCCQLADIGIPYQEVVLGEISLASVVAPEKLTRLKQRLEAEGLSIIYDRRLILAEKVKYLVYEMLNAPEPPEENYSNYISSRMFLNYTYLANMFSETQEITIEHFIINKKIEKAKELLLYSDHNISQIADALHYSSIGHLSNQFKKVTGYSPSEYKKQVQKDSMV